MPLEVMFKKGKVADSQQHVTWISLGSGRIYHDTILLLPMSLQKKIEKERGKNNKGANPGLRYLGSQDRLQALKRF
jgi:hypothetical protein